MIHRVDINNFKNILEQTIEFERFTVFVGANGSGKSSILEAIRLASTRTLECAGSSLDSEDRSSSRIAILWKQMGIEPDFHLDWVYRRGATEKLVVRCESDDGPFGFEGSPRNRKGLNDDPIPRKYEWIIKYTNNGANETPCPLLEPGRVLYSRIDASEVAANSYPDSEEPRVLSNGKGIASSLAFMKLNDPDSFSLLESTFRDLAPQVQRIRFRKPRIPTPQTEGHWLDRISRHANTDIKLYGDSVIFDYINAPNVEARTASEGTLLLLGLLTILLGPQRPRVLLMDDIDRALHPLAQKNLVDLISNLIQRFSDLQILATSHSPYLLDQLRPEQVRLVALDREGYCVCGRLDQHPEFEKWKDEMTPGELWSFFGERWLIDRGAER